MRWTGCKYKSKEGSKRFFKTFLSQLLVLKNVSKYFNIYTSRKFKPNAAINYVTAFIL